MEILLTWRPTANNHLLGGLAAKKSRAPLKLPKRQENVPPAKNITLLGGWCPPRKWINLAAFNRQEKALTWQLMVIKEGYLHGTEIIISLATNRQGNTYHQQKNINFETLATTRIHNSCHGFRKHKLARIHAFASKFTYSQDHYISIYPTSLD